MKSVRNINIYGTQWSFHPPTFWQTIDLTALCRAVRATCWHRLSLVACCFGADPALDWNRNTLRPMRGKQRAENAGTWIERVVHSFRRKTSRHSSDFLPANDVKFTRGVCSSLGATHHLVSRDVTSRPSLYHGATRKKAPLPQASSSYENKAVSACSINRISRPFQTPLRPTWNRCSRLHNIT
jgi:hypothetical protein